MPSRYKAFTNLCLQQKSTKMEEEANKYFLQLLKIYSDLPIKDHSFVSNVANLLTIACTLPTPALSPKLTSVGALCSSNFILVSQLQPVYSPSLQITHFACLLTFPHCKSG